MINQMRYATITEQGTTFTIVAVQLFRVSRKTGIGESLPLAYSRLFPGMPIILMARIREMYQFISVAIDIVNFLKVTDPSVIHWQTSSS